MRISPVSKPYKCGLNRFIFFEYVLFLIRYRYREERHGVFFLVRHPHRPALITHSALLWWPNRPHDRTRIARPQSRLPIDPVKMFALPLVMLLAAASRLHGSPTVGQRQLDAACAYVQTQRVAHARLSRLLPLPSKPDFSPALEQCTPTRPPRCPTA